MKNVCILQNSWNLRVNLLSAVSFSCDCFVFLVVLVVAKKYIIFFQLYISFFCFNAKWGYCNHWLTCAFHLVLQCSIIRVLVSMTIDGGENPSVLWVVCFQLMSNLNIKNKLTFYRKLLEVLVSLFYFHRSRLLHCPELNCIYIIPRWCYR